MVVLRTQEQGSSRAIKATKEPPKEQCCPLSTAILDDDEYYIYRHGRLEFMRRKLGSWVNITKFLPLIDDSPALNAELRRFKHSRFLYSNSTQGKRFNGLWVPLNIARRFAITHGLWSKVGPLLAFERVAIVSYSGMHYYEYFVHMSVDVSIRILREVSTNRVNMDQVFSVYYRLKGNKAVTALRRSLYFYHKTMRIKGDSTICGGHWMEVACVIRFSRKHGLFKHICPILEFDSSPDQLKAIPMDLYERTLRIHWRATKDDRSFFGFPSSFREGSVPSGPALRIYGKPTNRLSYDDFTIKTPITIQLTKKGRGEINRVTVLRRLSDGWVNCTKLIHACVLIRLLQLDLGEDDPDMKVENELHIRDVLEKYHYQMVQCQKAPTLNGKWCSCEDSLHIFNMFHISQTSQGKSILDLLRSTRFKQPMNNAQDDVEQGDGDDDNDSLEVLDEDDFLEMTSVIKKKDVYRDPKFFDNEGESSSEEDVEIHGISAEESSEEDDIVFGNTLSNVNLGLPDCRVHAASGSHQDDDALNVLPLTNTSGVLPSKKRKYEVIVLDEDEHSDHDDGKNPEYNKLSGQQNPVLIDLDADGHDKITAASGTPINDVLQLHSEEIIARLKFICIDIDQAISKPHEVYSKKVQVVINNNLKKLRYFNAVNEQMKIKSKLNNTFHNLRALSVSLKELQDLETRWCYESAQSPASITRSDKEPRTLLPLDQYKVAPLSLGTNPSTNRSESCGSNATKAPERHHHIQQRMISQGNQRRPGQTYNTYNHSWQHRESEYPGTNSSSPVYETPHKSTRAVVNPLSIRTHIHDANMSLVLSNVRDPEQPTSQKSTGTLNTTHRLLPLYRKTTEPSSTQSWGSSGVEAMKDRIPSEYTRFEKPPFVNNGLHKGAIDCDSSPKPRMIKSSKSGAVQYQSLNSKMSQSSS